jgi:hypothetical protein
LKNEAAANQGGVGEMRKRRTTLADGRYLIYYTFGDETDAAAAAADEGASEQARPAAKPFAEEERRV